MIEKLSPLDDIALDAMEAGLKKNDPTVLRLFMEYRYGKPKQTIDANVDGSLQVFWNEVKNYD